MIVVTLSRKPASEVNVAANLLRHGCGAINIGASRIRHSTAADLSASLAKNPGRDDTFTSGVYGEGRPQQSVNVEGRWPANVVFQHLAGCRRAGERKVRPGNGSGRAGPGGNGFRTSYVDGEKRAEGFEGGFVGADGTETVESWACVAGCPVANLDAQSGANGDVGGASRYFKQFGGDMVETSTVPDDFLDYLRTLITPTQVGGETLVALDLAEVSWKDVPDERYHGFIGRGEPTSEQVKEILRVLKPGAHVLLIAPDERPTGHRGACALEDGGFEIRDSILWVNRAGGLHYVPKANTRERNEGCEVLASHRKGVVTYELKDGVAEDDEVMAELMEALTDAGVPEEVINAMDENGLAEKHVPVEHRKLFKKRKSSDRYGNFHPCVKPKAVMGRLLADLPKEAKVCDPFMGSGSLGLACLETGHDYTGIEREGEYLEIADARSRHWARKQNGWVGVEIVSEAPPPKSLKLEVEHGDAADLFGVEDDE